MQSVCCREENDTGRVFLKETFYKTLKGAERAICFLVGLGILISSHAAAEERELSVTGRGSLPESIRRETHAAIDRARPAVAAAKNHKGLWTEHDGNHTVFPALALINPKTQRPARGCETVVRNAMRTARKNLLSVAKKPWSPHDAAEAAYTIIASSMLGDKSFAGQISTRLSKADISKCSPVETLFIASACEICGLDADRFWSCLAHTRIGAPNIEDVALIAAGRVMTNPKTTPGPLGNAVVSHLGWLGKEIDLGFHNPAPGNSEVLSPEAAFTVSDLLSRIPRKTLFLQSSAPPYDWRNHIANRLIAKQKYEPQTGWGYWENDCGGDPKSPESVRATVFAILTLAILAD